MHWHKCSCLYINTHRHMHSHTHIKKHTNTLIKGTHAHAHICIEMPMYTQAHTYICRNTWILIYTDTQTHTHTHTHTYTDAHVHSINGRMKKIRLFGKQGSRTFWKSLSSALITSLDFVFAQNNSDQCPFIFKVYSSWSLWLLLYQMC